MRLVLISLVVTLFFSCKDTKKKEQTSEPVKETTEKVSATESKMDYPEDFMKVLEAHGGIATWKAQKTLTFVKPNDKGFEHYTIDLHTRNEKVVSEEVERGNEGDKTWVLDPENNFKGDAVFYKNLYFYFYAMPFVLADKGINYTNTEALEVDGVSYPGVKVSFDQGVGTSPKDNYYLHYDPTTNQMAWLGYTVTYRTGEKSDKISWIHYNDWTEVSGLKLPKSISWHKAEGNKIMDVAKTVVFDNATLSEKGMENGYYAKPESATYVTRKES
ncbi:DUF6503 family protein [Cellulophaga sp. L1A9]|uniref:DUF6503 family protein n=1 Tax=Cellulophaga sp. L1A9 TaxID=2686362 RepID=UPI00131E0EC3|nr:DUF6503 family protein [Cellulophaga sp. L1A9]